MRMPAMRFATGPPMEEVLTGAGVGLEQVHHGDGVATWEVMERGLARGARDPGRPRGHHGPA